MSTSMIRLRSVKSSLPFSLTLRHSRDKLSQALSRFSVSSCPDPTQLMRGGVWAQDYFSVLQAMERWAGPGNEAIVTQL